MTVTINNFWGAETGGMEESSSSNGAIASSFAGRSGGYGYLLTVNSEWFELNPFEIVLDAGSKCILGFYVYFQNNFDGVSRELCKLWDGTNQDFAINVTSAGKLELEDSAGTSRITGTTILSVDTWYLVEVCVDRVNSGNAEFFITPVGESAVSQGTTSANDFNAITGTPVIRFTGHSSVLNYTYIEDIYFESGVNSASDRLGGCEVYGYRSSKNSSTPDDGGSNLNIGTWLLLQSIPFAGSVQAEYTNTGAGAIDTDDGSLGGPSGDANVAGHIAAIKGIWEMERAGGGGTEHYGLLGNNVGGTRHTIDIEPTTSAVVYKHIIDRSPFNLNNQSFTGKQNTLGGNGRARFSRDGTKYWGTVSTTGVISQYSLSTAWDIDTAVLDGTWTPTESSENLGGLDFNEDGSKVYVSFQNPDATVYQYSCSTNYDVVASTPSYDTKSFAETHTAWGWDHRLMDGGTKLFWLDAQNNRVTRYTLSTPDDISTASFDHQSITVKGGPRDVDVEATGTYMFTDSEDSPAALVLYRTETAWDFSVAVEHSRIMKTYGDWSGYFGRNGQQMFLRTTSNVREFNAGLLIPKPNEYCRIGMETVGAQDWEGYGMLATILHVPGVSLPPRTPGQNFQHMIVR